MYCKFLTYAKVMKKNGDWLRVTGDGGPIITAL